MVLHLLPEELAGFRMISIVEGTHVARAYPILDAVFDGLLIHPSLFIEFLVVFGSLIELRPHRHHDASVHVVDFVHHALRIRETFRVEFMATPSILRPVEPVEHDVVDRNLTGTELTESRKQFVLAIVLLTALPIAHRPLRHDLCLAGQRTITADDFVHILACHEVIVDFRIHFTPPRLLVLFGKRLHHTEATIRHIAIRQPFNLERHLLTAFQLARELITIWIPSRTPTFGHYQFAIDIHLHITGIVEDELVFTGFLRLDSSFIKHVSPLVRELLREIHHSIQFLAN